MVILVAELRLSAFLEHVANVVLALQKKNNYEFICAGSSTFSRGVLPRVAAKLDVSPISDVILIHGADTFTRPTYAGNAICKVCLI